MTTIDPIAIEAQMMGGDLIWAPYGKETDDRMAEVKGQTTAVTQYLVQVQRESSGNSVMWQDLGNYEAPSGNRRKAIEQAMEEHGIEEGSFHTIPETSQAIERCHIEHKLVWD